MPLFPFVAFVETPISRPWNQGGVWDWRPLRGTPRAGKDIMFAFLKQVFQGQASTPTPRETSSQIAIAGPRRVEAVLWESEEQFHKLVASVRDYAIFLLDSQGNVLTWNEGASVSRATGPTRASVSISRVFIPRTPWHPAGLRTS
jgi:hypothetical protein